MVLLPETCRGLRAGEIRGWGPAGELEAPAEDALGISCSGIEDVDEQHRLRGVLQGGWQSGVHGHAERTVIRAGVGRRRAGMRGRGPRQKVVRVADLNRTHDGDQEDRQEGEPAKSGRLVLGVAADLEEVSQ